MGPRGQEESGRVVAQLSIHPRLVPCSLTNVLPTAITVLCMASLIAGTAVGAALTHDIALSS